MIGHLLPHLHPMDLLDHHGDDDHRLPHHPIDLLDRTRRLPQIDLLDRRWGGCHQHRRLHDRSDLARPLPREMLTHSAGLPIARSRARASSKTPPSKATSAAHPGPIVPQVAA